MASAGYSGTPLPTKLGIKDGHVVALLAAPTGFAQALAATGALAPGARLVTDARAHRDVIVLFSTRRAELHRRLPALGKAIHPDGALWIAWPKRAAKVTTKVETDVTEDVVRAEALPLGLVDNKVCAIDAVWSGLRVVWRRERR